MLRHTLAFLLALVLASPAAAQYFGRNKVQYEAFDFKILRTTHFDIYYYPQERDAAVLAGRMAERWYERLHTIFGRDLDGRQPLILYANHPHFEQTNALQGELGEGTGGVTEVFKRRMVLPFGGSLAETDHVIGHELVHAFQFSVTGQGRSVQTGGIPGALTLPLWFIEGMAEYLSVGPVDPLTAMWMRDAAADDLPSLRDLGNAYKWFPYRWGQALWAWIAGTYGDEVVGRMLEVAGRARQPELALASIVGLSPEELTDRWHAALRERADTLRALTEPAATYGRDLFPEADAAYHIAPALSPDGERVAFVSERDLFSIDVYLADVATGRVIRRITRTAVDPHFESLQFIGSAGSFGPDGRTFALAGVVRGQPVVTLIDVETGETVRELRFPELGEIYTPVIAPDGRQLAFTALHGGLTDLYLYDLQTGQLRQLTHDPYADLQPAFSPDGRHLAWVTDRWGTELANLRYGPLRVGLYDLRSSGTAPLTVDGAGRQINPQWAPDGRTILFVSDAEGVNDLYRGHLDDGRVERLTTLYTGISGITATSPAISVASQAGTVAFTVYRAGRYRLFLTHIDSLAAEGPVPYADLAPAALPPRERVGERIPGMLADYATGLPDTASFATDDYGARLGLDYIAQPSLLFASDQFGSYLGGGAALYWSDVLGDHNLATILQVNGSLKDVTAAVGYTNLSRRLNWGVIVQQVPILYQQYASGFGTLDGATVFVEQIRRFRQTNRDVTGVLAYPFNRVTRFEVQAGYRNVHFSDEVETRFYEPVTLTQVDETRETLPTLPGMHLVTASAAHVFDNALFGATSPLLGQRWRLELGTVAGSVNYLTGLADFRRYMMPVRPFTIATQLLHYGRYGGGSEDSRLVPLYLGGASLVRGYDYRSFEITDCVPTPDEFCPLFSRLIGTRMAVAKAELRFPLLGALGVGSGFYGFLPLELAIFGDAGVAWRSDDPSTTATDERAWFLGGDRRPVTSAGVTGRVNLLGFAIIQVDYAYAFQRDRWLWQFSFQPGF